MNNVHMASKPIDITGKHSKKQNLDSQHMVLEGKFSGQCVWHLHRILKLLISDFISLNFIGARNKCSFSWKLGTNHIVNILQRRVLCRHFCATFEPVFIAMVVFNFIINIVTQCFIALKTIDLWRQLNLVSRFK